MIKRKEQKQTKRKNQRRRDQSRPFKQISSEKEVMKLLEKIPLLAYESDFDDLFFDEELIRMGLEKQLPEPQIVAQLSPPDVMEDIKKRLEKMDSSLPVNSQKGILVKTTLMGFDNSELPPYANPLIEAIYLKSKSKMEGEMIPSSKIVSEIAAYEEKYEEVMNEFLGLTGVEEYLSNDSETEEKEDHPEFSDGITDKDDVETVEESVTTFIDPDLKSAYLKTLSDLPEDNKEQQEDDIEVFLDDYLRTPFSECNASTMEDFISWFISKMNPMEDDIYSMRKSLKHFFKYISENEVLNSEELSKISGFLDDDLYWNKLVEKIQ